VREDSPRIGPGIEQHPNHALLRSGVVQPDGEVQRRGVLEAVLQVDVGLVQVEQERERVGRGSRGAARRWRRYSRQQLVCAL
jgi:hypothetical protein